MPSSESINDSEDFDSDNEVYDEDEDSDETKFVKSNSNLLNRLLEDDDELQEDSNNCDSDFDTAEENSNSEEQTNHSGEGNDMITDRSGISLEKSSGISLEKENEENTKGISLDKEPQPESRICLDKSESEEKTSSISLEKKEESEGTKSSNEKDETKEEETKKEEPESAEPAKKNPRLTDVKSDTPRLEHRTSSLREKLRKDNANKKDFVKINLETLSAIAVADIKRSSMSSTAIVDVEIAKAKGLHPVKSGPPSPMCLLAIRKDTNKDHEKKIELKKAHEQTSVLPKNSCPAWNEKKEIKLDQVKGESQRYLVLEIRDKGPKGEFLGFIELNLNNIADLVQREEWFTLQKRKKKDKVSGEILLRTRIRPERKVAPVIAIKGENFPAIPSFIYNSFWNQHCVTKLAITHCDIGSIPEGLSALGSLEVLQLSDNNIATVPKTLGRIFTLKFLDLSNNRISKLPIELSNLKNLQGFDISGNKFQEDTIPDCIVDLDICCDITGKPDTWDQLIEEELIKRETEEKQTDSDKAVMDEKEKEIQKLLQNMK